MVRDGARTPLALVAALLALTTGCAAFSGKLTQVLVSGKAGATPPPSSEFADPPLAVEGDEITVASTALMFDASMRLGQIAELTVGYGMLFPTVRARAAAEPERVADGANEFADRATVGASVPLLALGGRRRGDDGAASLRLRAYGELGIAVITNGTLSAPGPTFAINAGVQLLSDKGLYLLAGLVWEKGSLGDEAGDYSATGVEFGVGYRLAWPGAGGGR